MPRAFSRETADVKTAAVEGARTWAFCKLSAFIGV